MKVVAMLIGASAALAAGTPPPPTTFRVTVGAADKLLYNPDTVFASIGDQVQFEFYPQNHTVTQSSPTSPCTPLDNGFFSGFIAEVNGTTAAGTTFVVTINSTSPLYFYSSQGTECQQGMVGVVNPDNSTSQSTYASLAANVTNSTAPPTGPMGGVLETVATLSNDSTTTLLSTAMETPLPSSKALLSSPSTSASPLTGTGTGTATGSMTSEASMIMTASATPTVSEGGSVTGANTAASSTAAAISLGATRWEVILGGAGILGAGWAFDLLR
ncbi:hypothetical protein MMC19_000157 [Ptychographa xylographoides]|nr:hypothetical protein [Ptychographa xylographoides]